jgi:hypothetical protein
MMPWFSENPDNHLATGDDEDTLHPSRSRIAAFLRGRSAVSNLAVQALRGRKEHKFSV